MYKRINVIKALFSLMIVAVMLLTFALSPASEAAAGTKSPNVNILIINIAYNDPNMLSGKIYVYPGLDSASGSKAVTPTAMGIKNMLDSPHEYKGFTFTFADGFVLTNEDGGIVIGTFDDSELLDRIGIDNSKGEDPKVTVKFKDGRTDTYSFDGTNDYDIYISPVYTVSGGVDISLNWTDRVFGGSGSWGNGGAFWETYEHTFTAPPDAPSSSHYSFLYWKDTGSDYIFQAGKKYTFKNEYVDETYNICAMWQPSVTVNYYVSGEIAQTNESFDSVRVYDYTPGAPGKGDVFDGWYDENGARIADSAVYEAPEPTGNTLDVTQPLVINVYAQFSSPPAAAAPDTAFGSEMLFRIVLIVSCWVLIGLIGVRRRTL